MPDFFGKCGAALPVAAIRLPLHCGPLPRKAGLRQRPAVDSASGSTQGAPFNGGAVYGPSGSSSRHLWRVRSSGYAWACGAPPIDKDIDRPIAPEGRPEGA